MSRPLRIEWRAGGWYHLTARGNERRPIFLDNRDRAHFCELLSQIVERFRVRLHAFVLMDNHYHVTWRARTHLTPALSPHPMGGEGETFSRHLFRGEWS